MAVYLDDLIRNAHYLKVITAFVQVQLVVAPSWFTSTAVLTIEHCYLLLFQFIKMLLECIKCLAQTEVWTDGRIDG